MFHFPMVVLMHVPSRDLTPDDMELIAFARQIVDANTDGENGVHTRGTGRLSPVLPLTISCGLPGG